MPDTDVFAERHTDSGTDARLLRETGRIPFARWCPSPNFGPRPDGVPISLLVVHNISLPPGQFGGPEIEDFFCNRLDHSAHPYFQTIEGVQVSAHLLIRRDGVLVQFVSLLERAWHAGRSCFGGQDECKDFSLGYDLKGPTDIPPNHHPNREGGGGGSQPHAGRSVKSATNSMRVKPSPYSPPTIRSGW